MQKIKQNISVNFKMGNGKVMAAYQVQNRQIILMKCTRYTLVNGITTSFMAKAYYIALMACQNSKDHSWMENEKGTESKFMQMVMYTRENGFKI